MKTFRSVLVAQSLMTTFFFFSFLGSKTAIAENVTHSAAQLLGTLAIPSVGPGQAAGI